MTDFIPKPGDFEKLKVHFESTRDLVAKMLNFIAGVMEENPKHIDHPFTFVTVSVLLGYQFGKLYEMKERLNPSVIVVDFNDLVDKTRKNFDELKGELQRKSLLATEYDRVRLVLETMHGDRETHALIGDFCRTMNKKYFPHYKAGDWRDTLN